VIRTHSSWQVAPVGRIAAVAAAAAPAAAAAAPATTAAMRGLSLMRLQAALGSPARAHEARWVWHSVGAIAAAFTSSNLRTHARVG